MHDEFGSTKIIHGVTHCFNSGSSSSTTSNSYLPSQKKAAGLAGTELKSLLPQLMSQSNTGLSSLEKSHYGGELQRGVAENTASATAAFNDQNARTGNLAGKGAEVEGRADIARAGVQGTARGLSSLTGMDITQKQQNFKNLLAALGLAYSPSPTGSSSQGSSTPSMLSTIASII